MYPSIKQDSYAKWTLHTLVMNFISKSVSQVTTWPMGLLP